MSQSDDEILNEQELQESLPKIREDLRSLGLSEEEIAEGISGLPDRIPQLRGMLAELVADFGHFADGPPLGEE